MRILIKLLLILVFFNTNSLKADILKPLSSILPAQVIKIQLEGLMENDTPYKDRGIEQTWEFAHPINQRFTGPLNRFKEMIKGDSYKMLLNHVSHEIEEVYSDKDKAVYQVVVLDANKDFYKFRWQVEKFLKSGPLENCWLTTMVSQPISMGSST
tara:strand:+ start:146 stop:610 length:465 start_codon:yes stop_codon:yes gene_type:complete